MEFGKIMIYFALIVMLFSFYISYDSYDGVVLWDNLNEYINPPEIEYVDFEYVDSICIDHFYLSGSNHKIDSNEMLNSMRAFSECENIDLEENILLGQSVGIDNCPYNFEVEVYKEDDENIVYYIDRIENSDKCEDEYKGVYYWIKIPQKYNNYSISFDRRFI